MTVDIKVPSSVAEPARATPSLMRKARVAVVCDYIEERWHSMNLVGDMLCHHLTTACSDCLDAGQVRPALRRRISRLPFVPSKQAWNADRLLNRFVDYPSLLRRNQHAYDLFHIVDHSYAQLVHTLPAGRTIVTCHDLDTFRCLLEPGAEPRPRWFRMMSRRILSGLQKAAHVIAVSAATRDELLRRELLAPDKVTVIPNGVHTAFTAAPNPVSDRDAARLLEPAPSRGPWLLSVGSTLERKRLDMLLRVFANVYQRFPQARLVRVGGFTPAQHQLAADLSIAPAVVMIPYVEPDTLAALYRHADLLLQTSEAEGFGLPLIEAMACGCPVAASDIPVLREVGGDAAEYCRVADLDQWTATVGGLIVERLENGPAWHIRKQQALARAANYSWTVNARQTAATYQQVLANL